MFDYGSHVQFSTEIWQTNKSGRHKKIWTPVLDLNVMNLMTLNNFIYKFVHLCQICMTNTPLKVNVNKQTEIK